MQRVRISCEQSPVFKLGDAQVRLTSKFRLAPVVNPPPLSQPKLDMDPDPPLLIPGLPDDIAINCILRLPVHVHPTCRSVCRRWHALLATKDRFFTHRKALHLRHPWLFVVAFHNSTGSAQWQVLDLSHFSWHTIPPMPFPRKDNTNRVCPRGFATTSLPDQSALLVCGGCVVSDEDVDDFPLNLVLRFDLQTNRWTVLPRMLTPRAFFAVATIEGLVYSAGGVEKDHFELASAEVLGPAAAAVTIKSKWKPIPDMGTSIACYDSAVLDGRLSVTEGWTWPFMFSPRGQVYDPVSNSWEAMKAGLREGWTGRSAVVDGRLFVLSEHESLGVLKVYDMESDSWDTVIGSPLPETIQKPVSLSSTGDWIYVVGRRLHVAAGHVRRLSRYNSTTRDDEEDVDDDGVDRVKEGKKKFMKNRRSSFAIRWQRIDAPLYYSELAPSSSQIMFA